MNNTLSVFRTLIILALVLGLAGALVDMIAADLVPEALSKAYEDYQPIPESQWVAVGIFALILLIAGLTGAIGLMVLARWARTLSLWVTVAAIAASAFFGVSLYSGPAMAITDTSTMLWGAVLAMAYFSDLRVHFDRRSAAAAAA